jgi:DNA modification methylase
MNFKLFVGNCLEKLQDIPDNSIHCCVTSPPYWGLRDYQTAKWEGGDPDCDHKIGRFTTAVSAKQKSTLGSGEKQATEVCPKCGAVRIDDQIGLEKTPQEFVSALIEVFREVRRVLRSDGVCFVNLGDSYASAWPCSRRSVIGNGSLENGKRENRAPRMPDGLKEKDLCGIPWRVAFALQDDGWWLRQDIIWAKGVSGQDDLTDQVKEAAEKAGCKQDVVDAIVENLNLFHGNPMPASVKDRCSTSHEYFFLLTKSARYFYDQQAIIEECCSSPSDLRKMVEQKDRIDAKHFHVDPGAQAAASSKTNIGNKRAVGNPDGRNRRSVWAVPTQPFRGAHFAPFPTRLIMPAIKAGTSEKGCCPECGAPWVRIVTREPSDWEIRKAAGEAMRHGLQGATACQAGGFKTPKVLGSDWKPGCSCDAGEPIPCTVLDPFFGAGTTAVVSYSLGRSCMGTELSPEYAKMCQERFEELVGIVGHLNNHLLKIVGPDDVG